MLLIYYNYAAAMAPQVSDRIDKPPGFTAGFTSNYQF